MQQQQMMQMQQQQQFIQWAMEETIKSGTSIEHGGYMAAPEFNPSDMMHYDSTNQMSANNMF